MIQESSELYIERSFGLKIAYWQIELLKSQFNNNKFSSFCTDFIEDFPDYEKIYLALKPIFEKEKTKQIISQILQSSTLLVRYGVKPSEGVV